MHFNRPVYCGNPVSHHSVSFCHKVSIKTCIIKQRNLPIRALRSRLFFFWLTPDVISHCPNSHSSRVWNGAQGASPLVSWFFQCFSMAVSHFPFVEPVGHGKSENHREFVVSSSLSISSIVTRCCFQLGGWGSGLGPRFNTSSCRLPTCRHWLSVVWWTRARGLTLG